MIRVPYITVSLYFDFILLVLYCMGFCVGTPTGLLLVLLIVGLVYRFRWKIRYRLYRCGRTHQCCGYGGDNEGYSVFSSTAQHEYAAYLSCCDECQDLVNESLMPDVDSGPVSARYLTA